MTTLDLDLHHTNYLSLRTFRADGSAVDVPIWFVADGDRVWFRTKSSTAKVRRISRNPTVEVRPCDWKGRPLGTTVVRATAHRLEGEPAEHANQRLHRRYGWKWNSVPLVRLPGTNTVKMSLTRRQWWQHLRATSLWPESCIIELTLEGAARSPHDD